MRDKIKTQLKICNLLIDCIKIPRFPFFIKKTGLTHTTTSNTTYLLILHWIPNKTKLVPSMTALQLLVKLKNHLSRHHTLCNSLRRYGIRMNTSRWQFSLRRKVQPCRSFAARPQAIFQVHVI